MNRVRRRPVRSKPIQSILMRIPGGQANLVAELEPRLMGTSASPGLNPELAATISDAATSVLAFWRQGT